MATKQVVRVPLDEIRRTMESLDALRAAQREQGYIRVPHDEILRVMRQLDRQHAEDRALDIGCSSKRRRPHTETTRRKRPRSMEDVLQHQRQSIESILQYHEACFRDKERASVTRSWCNEVPLCLQVEASKSFYEAFSDASTLPISHCIFCCKMQAPCKLAAIQWKRLLTPFLMHATRALQQCEKCLPPQAGVEVNVCFECRSSLEDGKLPKTCRVNNMDIGCEHRYPEELDALSPVEERLIALHSPFGYITKFSVDSKTPSGISYRRHVKGHIVVFPNKVDDLVATVLPHPLLQAIENIHVSWSGSSEPGPADVAHLLQVRKSRVRAALVWLQKNNPLYEHVIIDQAEMDNWRYADGTDVPSIIMERMQREEPSAVEKTRTDHIVPDTDRGLEGNGFTSIDELLTSMHPQPANESCPTEDTPSTELHRSSPGAPCGSGPGLAPADSDVGAIRETTSSGMFPLDGPTAFAEADKLSFFVDALKTSQNQRDGEADPCSMQVETTGNQPFIRVERGADFADNLHEDFFPRTFPTLFPWGKGGPKARHRSVPIEQHDPDPVGYHSNHSLKYWARYVLQRHGGRFATHPVFCFLVFNILLRSSNRRISMVRVAKGSFHRLEQVYESLTTDRLKKAGAEMRETRTTSDPDISFLLRELSIFGHAQPLSNESRLLMRKKIQALIVWIGMPAVWITINPNDINNPVKIRLSIHRLHDYDAACDLLADLQDRYERIALSIMDPVSAAIFFHREVSLFFDKYVRAGKESVFGKISHYYATVETNERGSLHLHGLLWLEGNMQLPSLLHDMANPKEDTYRTRVVRYVDSVFHECLDEDAGRAVRRERKPIHVVEGMMDSIEALTAAFDDESNFIAFCCQVHSHTYTCLKYSLKGLVEQGAENYKRTACRFKAPWKIVEDTGFTEDGLLRVRRDHPLVNRYNKSLAVGLRHNHDVSIIVTRTKGLAMLYYITNYATKLDTPMWKRLALAADVLRQLHQPPASRHQISDSAKSDDRRLAVLNESRQFLMRAANRIFSERQLSAVEVCYHLLGYGTDFTNVPDWSFLNLTALYWSIFRRWPRLRCLAGKLTDAEEPPETVPLRESGRTLLYLDAYAFRGPILRDLCLYDYMSMINLMRRQGNGDDESHICLEGPSPEYHDWIQKLREPHQYAVPIFQGFISDDHHDEHPVYIKRNSVLHLALFVPWEEFLSRRDGDITHIWSIYEATLSPRLRFHVSNICLLRKSVEDARQDAKLWASRSEGDDTIDVELPLDENEYTEAPSVTAEHHQNYAALLQALQNAVQDSHVTRGSPVLEGLIRDLRQEDAAEEGRSFVQRQESFYQKIRRIQGGALSQYPTPSLEDVQAVAKAQDLLHLRMLDEVEAGHVNPAHSKGNADIDDMLVRHGDTEVPLPHQHQDPVIQGPQMVVDVAATGGFVELGNIAASNYTLNHLQTMALQLVCGFLDRYTADPDSAAQHFQYTGGPGGTGKSRIIDALKDVFAARGQRHLLQITGTSGSAAAQIGGTTVHSACGLDAHRSPNKQLATFSEAKKWVWKQKIVLVVDEISMLGGATLYDVSQHLQSLRDCPDKPFGGIPVVLLMGDFYQFAPVRETSLLVNKMLESALSPLRQATISHHRGYSLWHMFKTVVLLEEQVRARDDPQLGALLDRVRAGVQTQQDLDLLNAKLVDRSEIAFHSGLRAITPLNRNRWNLNMEAVVDWARFNNKHISIFVSAHAWRMGAVCRSEITRTIEQGDDSVCKVPGIFFYAQGMPAVVNKNIYTGMKIVNGAEFTAADVIPDPKYPGYYLADDVTIHFGPPLGILLKSKETDDLVIPGLPMGTILIRPMSQTLDPANPRFKSISAKCTRRGLPVVPAFVVTDYKAQGKTFSEVLLELRGNRITNGEHSKCDFTSLYVQLSRCTTLQGIKLLSPIRQQDFIGNRLDQTIVDGMQRLRVLAAETRQLYENHICGT